MPGIKAGIGPYSDEAAPKVADQVRYLMPIAKLLFILVAILGFGFCMAMLLIATVEGIQLKAMQPGEFKAKNADMTALSIAICLSHLALHFLGYQCRFMKLRWTSWDSGLFILGFVVVISAFFAVFVMVMPTDGINVGKDDAYGGVRAYIAMGFTGLELLAMFGFIICAMKTHCFGGCMTLNKKVFYTFAFIYMLVFAAHAYTLYDLKERPNDYGDKETTWHKHRFMAAANYIFVIGLCISAYQVNLCCMSFTKCDGVFIFLTGTVVGILITVCLSMFPDITQEQWTLVGLIAMLYILTVALFLYIHAKRPLCKYYNPDVITFGIFTLLFLLLVSTLIALGAKYHTNIASIAADIKCGTLIAMFLYGFVVFVIMLVFGFKGNAIKVIKGLIKQARDERFLSNAHELDANPLYNSDSETPGSECNLRGPESSGGVFRDSWLHPTN
ncbi:putative integral membrane protein [Babesia bovis T2Bo]|uniref:Membrane protein, putative n=1 Tax=Babesia bovis TaxID=5865 RepID=A7AUW6_BABBO|nr:putative integral membrane protein [Babesia bovis T2Bo]EDO06727.1 putative integral membrane protein [Babesia bovis T2Bo]|eukprot:XP_001610295.1 membrane protein [Babesia bovis T2Bo]